MIRIPFLALFLLFLHTVPLLSKIVIGVDIHGVLLHEDIDRYVQHTNHMAELTAELNKSSDMPLTRGGVQEHNMFRTLCKMMMHHAPLGQPTDRFKKYIQAQMRLPKEKRKLIPFETYQLFCGAVKPQDMHPKISAMITAAVFDANDTDKNEKRRREMQTFVDTIFEREKLIHETMVILTQGVNIIKKLAENPENTLVIYSNAPHEWVQMYSSVFPDIFGDAGIIKQKNILSSGLTGHLKPLKEAFTALRSHVNLAEDEHIYLIDDSLSNIVGSADYHVTGIHFSYKKPQECINSLVEHKLLT